MIEINHGILNNEIAQVAVTIRENSIELTKAEALVEQIKEVIAQAEGGIRAFEYLRDQVLKEEEPETPKPDDSDSGEEA